MVIELLLIRNIIVKIKCDYIRINPYLGEKKILCKLN